jgi:hypothetical protein
VAGEPQVRECLRSQSAQKGVEVGYFVVAHRPKRDAHNLLYGSFMQWGGRYDAMVKLDADMVLTRGDILERAVDELHTKPNTKVLFVPVTDFFTGNTILGMHVDSGGASWRQRADNLFTDANDFTASEQSVSDLGIDNPVLHAHEPSDFQAFHFGVHRGVKVRAAARQRRYRYVVAHLRNAESVRKQATSGSSPHGVALLGLSLGLDATFGEADLSYTEPAVRDWFAEHVECTARSELQPLARRRFSRALARQPALGTAYTAIRVRDGLRARRSRP